MSTRGSVGYIFNDEVKLYYNRYDSYPSGIGKSILSVIENINSENKWNDIKSNIKLSELLNFEYDIYEDCSFINNSLFCEYAYIINLDSMVLEYYNGYQKVPQIGNRFGLNMNEDGYYPCRLVSVFNINDINKNNINDIIEKMDSLAENENDDISVEKFFRKIKLETINEKTS